MKKIKSKLRKEALAEVLQFMRKFPHKLKSLTVNDKQLDFIDIKKVSPLTTDEIKIANKYLKNFINSSLYEVIKKEFSSVVASSHSMVIENKEVGFSITRHAREQFIKRSIIIYFNDVCHFDIGERKINDIESKLKLMIQILDQNDFNNPIIDTWILKQIKSATLKRDNQLGNNRNLRKYKARKGSNETILLHTNPYMFIIETSTRLLKTIELHSSSFKYERLNQKNAILHIKYKIQKWIDGNI